MIVGRSHPVFFALPASSSLIVFDRRKMSILVEEAPSGSARLHA